MLWKQQKNADTIFSLGVSCINITQHRCNIKESDTDGEWITCRSQYPLLYEWNHTPVWYRTRNMVRRTSFFVGGLMMLVSICQVSRTLSGYNIWLLQLCFGNGLRTRNTEWWFLKRCSWPAGGSCEKKCNYFLFWELSEYRTTRRDE